MSYFLRENKRDVFKLILDIIINHTFNTLRTIVPWKQLYYVLHENKNYHSIVIFYTIYVQLLHIFLNYIRSNGHGEVRVQNVGLTILLLSCNNNSYTMSVPKIYSIGTNFSKS